MKGDISRDSFRPEKRHSAVRLQQGRVLLDSEWNESVDIAAHRGRTAGVDAFGRTGAPAGYAGLAPQIAATADGDDLELSAGRFYVEGLLCEWDAPLRFREQADWPGQTLPSTEGVYLAYLDAWERGVGVLEDPELREKALAGVETATRSRVVQQLKLLRVGDANDAFHSQSEPPAWNALQNAARGRMSAATVAGANNGELCAIGAPGGYDGAENQLYRVEIHRGGAAGAASFKWARDNASQAVEILEHVGDELRVRSVGRDRIARFQPGEWAEIVDDAFELNETRGTLVRVLAADDQGVRFDPDSVIHYDDALNTAPRPAIDLAVFAGRPRLRRWNQQSSVGEITVPSDGSWVTLEHGVQVRFSSEAGELFSTGDAWQIPARVFDRNIEWPCDNAGAPLAQPPREPVHHRARIAFLRYGDAGTGTPAWSVLADCRRLFPALGDVNLFYAGGAGQETMPASPLGEALAVRTAAGGAPVQDVRVQFQIATGAGSLATEAGGTNQGATIVVRSDAEGIARAWWTLDATENHQVVSAALLGPGDAQLVQMRFHANLSTASGVYYEASAAIADGADPGPEPTVQIALDQLYANKVNRAGDTVTGTLNILQDLNVEGNLTITGDVIARDEEHVAGNVNLGDAPEDEIRINGQLLGPVGGELHVADTIQADQDVWVAGQLGVGIPEPAGPLAPFAVNQDLVVGDTGFVGVGTPTPAARLHVQASVGDTPLSIESEVQGVGGRVSRLAVDVSNTGAALADYQALLVLDSAALIAAGKLRADLGDLRITDSDGTTPLYHWVEAGQNSDATRVWVRIPSLVTGDRRIYLNYGNPDAYSLYPRTRVFLREIAGVVAAYDLDAGAGTSVDDRSGGGNTANFAGDPAWSAGRFDNALQFDGSDDGLLIAHDPSLNPVENISVAAWLYCDGPGNGAEADQLGVILAKQFTNAARSYQLALRHADRRLVWRVYGSDDTLYELASDSALAYGEWYHITAWYHRGTGTLKIYVNGNEDAQSVPGVFDLAPSTVPATVACYLDSNDGSVLRGFFQGRLDDVRIYDRALLDAEAAALFNHRSYISDGLPGRELIRVAAPAPEPTVAPINIALEETQPLETQSALHIQNGTGHVGIGTLTPGERLSVDGVIESQAGGVRFPDGSLQTTAWDGNSAWIEGGGTVHTDAKAGVGTDQPEAELDVAGDVIIRNDLLVEGKLRVRDADVNYRTDNWEYEHIIIRGIQGGGYAGNSGWNYIHQTIFATEVTTVVPGNVHMQYAKAYSAGVSGRQHGYFLGTSWSSTPVPNRDNIDKFFHATNSVSYLGGVWPLHNGFNPYTFSDERNEKSYIAVGTNSNEQIKVDNMTDTIEWQRANNWSAGGAGSGGFHDANYGWVSSGARAGTLKMDFATETFVELPVSCRGGGDGSLYNGTLNTRRGLGYKISSNTAALQFRVDRFDYATETWAVTNSTATPFGECAWHGGLYKGYTAGGYNLSGSYVQFGGVMDYATEVVLFMNHLRATVALSALSIQNSGY